MRFVAAKNGMTTNFFHPSLLLLFLDLVVLKHKKARCSTISASVADPDPIWDYGDGKQNLDPGSAINIMGHISKI